LLTICIIIRSKRTKFFSRANFFNVRKSIDEKFVKNNKFVRRLIVQKVSRIIKYLNAINSNKVKKRKFKQENKLLYIALNLLKTKKHFVVVALRQIKIAQKVVKYCLTFKSFAIFVRAIQDNITTSLKIKYCWTKSAIRTLQDAFESILTFLYESTLIVRIISHSIYYFANL